jgi:hypothetical protein
VFANTGHIVSMERPKDFTQLISDLALQPRRGHEDVRDLKLDDKKRGDRDATELVVR